MRKFFGILFMLLGLAMIAGSGWLIYGNKTEDETAGSMSEAALVEMREFIDTAPKAAVGTKENPVLTGNPDSEVVFDPEVTFDPMVSLNPEVTSDPAVSVDPEVTSDPAVSVDPEVTPDPVGSLNPVTTSAPAETLGPKETPVPDDMLPAATPIPEMPTIKIDGHEYIGYLEIPTIGISLPVMSDWSYPKLRIAPCRYWGSAYDDSLVIMAHNYDRHFGRINALEIGVPVQFIDAEGNIFRYVVAGHEQLERTDVEEMVSEPWDLTLFTCTYGGAKRVTVRLSRVDAFAAN